MKWRGKEGPKQERMKDMMAAFILINISKSFKCDYSASKTLDDTTGHLIIMSEKQKAPKLLIVGE